MPIPVSDRYVTAAQLADLLQVGEKTIRTWAKQGRIPHLKGPGPKGHLRFDPARVQAVLEHGSEEPADAG